MIVQKIPRFESGNILSREMLEALNFNCLSERRMNYFGYSDGIVKGLSVTASAEYVTVGKGCYLFDREVQYVMEDVKVPYAYGNEMKLLVLRTGDKEVSRQFETREAEIKLIGKDERILTDIEICRFSIQNGARLRDYARNLSDMSTYYDTICVCHAQWAAYENPSAAYPVLLQFAKELAMCKNLTTEDNLIIGQILELKGESLSKQCIEAYVSHKLQHEFKADSAYKLYTGLCEALKLAKNSRQRMERRAIPERRIIVD